jgi:hypothetical protein
MDKVFTFLGLFAFGLTATMVRLFVFTKVWALTVVSLGAPQIGMLQALGISFLLGVFQKIDTTTEDLKKQVSDTLSGVLSALLIWGLAALIF